MGAYVYLPPPPTEVRLGAPKIDMFQILYCIEMEKYIQFGARYCQKCAFYEKKFHESCQALNSVVSRGTRLSSPAPGVEQAGSKDCQL